MIFTSVFSFLRNFLPPPGFLTRVRIKMTYPNYQIYPLNSNTPIASKDHQPFPPRPNKEEYPL